MGSGTVLFNESSWYLYFSEDPKLALSCQFTITRRIPMALQTNTSETIRGSQEQFEALLHEQLRQAVRLALISFLDAEVDAFIGALSAK